MKKGPITRKLFRSRFFLIIEFFITVLLLASLYKLPQRKIQNLQINNIYINQYFSINYPSSWHVKELLCQDCPVEVSKKSSAIVFLPVNSNKGIDMFIYDNIKNNANLVMEEKLIKDYSWNNKKVESVSYTNIYGIKVSGTDEKGIEESVAVFKDSRNIIYRIQTEGDYSQFFDPMLSSFTLLN